MKKSTKHWIVAVCVIITFIAPIVQLAIGFHHIVKDGEKPNIQCEIAPDLPVLLAIGGIFVLLFLGAAYGLLIMISSTGKVQSDFAGKGPKILIGLVSFIFGAITLIFFILIQMRVYGAYSNHVQFSTQPAKNYCRSAIIHGALATIILTYINIVLLIGLFVLIFISTRDKLQEKKQIDMEMVPRYNNHRL